ncbi:uncharacterized protein LOC120372227 [Mauremys reevesii]|uniref:uncharacterized protein LOC120372227 n=1 Tax=Mauremys reevesii TaxID=260615 RepID=UPI00193F0457|nr:uncharacterized protein LOC120372227 [Mauremys reevesii]
MFSRRVQSCFFILLILGFSQALLIDVPLDSVNGTVSHSVLLPVSYRLQGPFPSPLSIQWNFSNNPNPLVLYTVTNCSVSAEGIPTRCSGYNYIHPTYQGRTEFFPENASLLLQNLQLSDSGVYSVIFKVPQQTRRITLIVSEPHFNHRNADTGSEDMKARSTSKAVCAIFAVSVLCGFITIGALFVVLFLHFTHMTCALLPSSQESFESC